MCAMKVHSVLKKDPFNKETPFKYYLSQQSAGRISLDLVAREIAMRSSLTTGDVKSVLSNLLEIMPLFLKLGYTLQLDEFGCFRVVVKSQGRENRQDLTVDDLKEAKVIFVPGNQLKEDIRQMDFTMNKE